MLGSMAQSFFPLSTAPLLTRSQYWFVLVMAAYLCASAFGALAVPGTGLSYANVCFVFLLTTIGGSRSREDWGVAILLLALMVLDIIFRILLKDLSGLGYSVNIGRMAVFVLLAKQYWQLPCKIRLGLVFVFGAAAFFSEIFVIYNPEYRMALFNAESVAEGFGFELYRPTGLIGDPNYFAFPLALMAVAAFQARHFKWFFVACCLMLATGSRSAVIAVLVPVMLLQMSRVKNNGLAVVGIMVGCFVVLIFAAAANAILRQGTTSESNAERLGLIVQSFINIATFGFLENTFGMPSALALDGERLVVHNTYLQTLSTSFSLGLFIVIRTFQGFWRKSFSPILLCVVIEMMFLDISSHSAFFMIFIMYSYTMPRIK